MSKTPLSFGVRLRGVRILVVRSLPTGPHWRSTGFGPQFTRWSVRKSALYTHVVVKRITIETSNIAFFGHAIVAN